MSASAREKWLERKLAEAPPVTPERLDMIVSMLPAAPKTGAEK